MYIIIVVAVVVVVATAAAAVVLIVQPRNLAKGLRNTEAVLSCSSFVACLSSCA